MKHSRIPLVLVLLLISVRGVLAQRELVINEIMYAPETGKSEWIEIFNRSDQSVSLKDWGLHDATASRPIITTDSARIPPGAYRIIARDSSILDDFPDLDSMLVIMDRFPSLNNTGDDVVLLRADRSAADSLRFTASWGGQGGRSLERIDTEKPGASADNWSTSSAFEGSTPGRRNSRAALGRDLCVTRISLDPPVARRRTPVRVIVVARNDGTMDADSLLVTLHEDVDRNGSADQDELVFQSVIASPLAPKDSLEVSGILPASDSTIRFLIASAELRDDERTGNNSRRDTVHFAASIADIVINEIMYAPTGERPEWVELYNPGSVVVDLAGWSIGDNTSWQALPGTAALLHPGEFLLLAAGSGIDSSLSGIPCTVLAISLPSLNNGGDDVRLRDRFAVPVDSVRYDPSWGGGSGASLERRNSRGPSAPSTNWGASEADGGSTPGRPNSIITLAHDLAVVRITRDDVDLLVTVRNEGLVTAEQAGVRVFCDEDEDRIADQQEYSDTRTIPAVLPSDSVTVRFSLPGIAPGASQFVACIDWADDARHSNDTTVQSIVMPFLHEAVRLNEIMFEPLQGDAEWVEYVNTMSIPLNIQGCSIADAPGSDGLRDPRFLGDRPLRIPPGGYLVVASDSSVFRRFPRLGLASEHRVIVTLGRTSLNLGNSDDEVVFIDPLGYSVDSIRYSALWHHPGVASTAGLSLERISPALPGSAASSWSTTCITDGGTPGEANSMYADIAHAPGQDAVTLTASPNPFSPDRDGREDVCIFSWRLPSPIAQVRIRIYDSRGHLVRTLADVSRSGERGEIVWDGYGDDGLKLSVGVYIALLDAVDSRTNMSYHGKALVVAATQL